MSDNANRAQSVQHILECIMERPGVSSATYLSELTNRTKKDLQVDLDLLVSEGHIRKSGGGYVIEAGDSKDAPAQISDSKAERIQAIRLRLRSELEKRSITQPIQNGAVRRKIAINKDKDLKPVLEGMGNRGVQQGLTWRPLRDRTLGASYTEGKDKVSGGTLPASISAKDDIENDYLNCYWGWVGTIEPEYDLLEPWTILDTESLMARAIERKVSLAFRNGIEITGDNQQFVKYIERRLEQISFVSRQSFESMLKEILRHLYICSNCVVLKIRDTEASGGVANDKNKNRQPIAKYKILPPHTIFPYMNGKAQIEKWRRYFGNGHPYRDYLPEDIIHFYWDRKPGHIFGTPRGVTFRDDIFALRRLEENIELLLVNHLFPLFHVAVGTEEAPAQVTESGVSELDVMRSLLQDMPKEGVFVTDERVKVDVHGAAKEGVDPTPLLAHYKQRVLIGLGVSSVDLGIADTSNKSTSDNVSQNLKESVEADTSWLADQVKYYFFLDLFSESPSQLSVQNAVSDVKVEFHEIDTDTHIKKQNHAIESYNNNAIDHDELRKTYKLKPMEKSQLAKTHHEMQTVALAKLQHKQNKELAESAQEAQSQTAAAVASSTKTTKVTRKFANGGSRSTHVTEPVKSKSVANKNRPANQHGTNLDPHKAKTSQDPDLVSVIQDSFHALYSNFSLGEVNADVWNVDADALCRFLLPGSDPVVERARWNLLASVMVPTVDSEFDIDLLDYLIEAWAEDPTRDFNKVSKAA